jgi:beta-lactamase regulating signal transducer with metallopeptidase domain
MINSDLWIRLATVLAAGSVLIVALAQVAEWKAPQAAVRRALWQFAFVLLVTLAASELSGAGRAAATFLHAQAESELPQMASPPQSQPAWQPVAAVDANRSVDLTDVGDVATSAVQAETRRDIWWPGMLWLVGFGIVAARVLFSQAICVALGLRRRRADALLISRVEAIAAKLGFRRSIRVTVMGGLKTPIAFGLFNPTVGVPVDFATRYAVEQQDAMLAHELAHLTAGDPFWRLVADGACALFWWNPLAWRARSRFHAACEMAADEAVSVIDNGPATLAECLLALGRECSEGSRWAWMGMDGGGLRSNLGKRVERLLRDSPRTTDGRKRPSGVVKFSVGAALVLLTVVASGWAESAPESGQIGFVERFKSAWASSPGGAIIMAASTPSLPAASPASGEAVAVASTLPCAASYIVDLPAMLWNLRAVPKYRSLAVTNAELSAVQATALFKALFEKEGVDFSAPNTSVKYDSVSKDVIFQGAPSDFFIVGGVLFELNPIGTALTFKRPGMESLVIDKSEAVRTYSFQIDTIAIIRSLPKGSQPASDDYRIADILKAEFEKAGVVFKPPQPMMFYNRSSGQLVVRAGPADIQIINNVLNRSHYARSFENPPVDPAIDSDAPQKPVYVYKLDLQAALNALRGNSRYSALANSTNAGHPAELFKTLFKNEGADFSLPNKVLLYDSRKGSLSVRGDPADNIIVERALTQFFHVTIPVPFRLSDAGVAATNTPPLVSAKVYKIDLKKIIQNAQRLPKYKSLAVPKDDGSDAQVSAFFKAVFEQEGIDFSSLNKKIQYDPVHGLLSVFGTRADFVAMENFIAELCPSDGTYSFIFDKDTMKIPPADETDGIAMCYFEIDALKVLRSQPDGARIKAVDNENSLRVSDVLRKEFERAGVVFKSPQPVMHYNEISGQLIVRAGPADTKMIKDVLNRFHYAISFENPTLNHATGASNAPLRLYTKAFLIDNLQVVLDNLALSPEYNILALTNSDPKRAALAELFDKIYSSQNPVGKTPTNSTQFSLATTNDAQTLAQFWRALFDVAGVDLQAPGKTVFYHAPPGQLMVRASLEDLSVVETLLGKLCHTPQQIKIAVSLYGLDDQTHAEFTNILALFSVNADGQRPPSGMFFKTQVGEQMRLLSGPGSLNEDNAARPRPAGPFFFGSPSQEQSRMLLEFLDKRAGASRMAEVRFVTLPEMQGHTFFNLARDTNSAAGLPPIGIGLKVTPAFLVGTNVLLHFEATAMSRANSLAEPVAELRSFKIDNSAWTQDQAVLVVEGLKYYIPDKPFKHMILLMTPTLIDPAGNPVFPKPNH